MNGVFLCEKPFYTVLMLGKSESQGVLFTKCHFARTKETNIPIYRKGDLTFVDYWMVYLLMYACTLNNKREK